MVTYAQLWEVDPDAWRAVGAAWRGLVAMVERRRAALVTAAGGLGSAWKSAFSTANWSATPSMRRGCGAA